MIINPFIKYQILDWHFLVIMLGVQKKEKLWEMYKQNFRKYISCHWRSIKCLFSHIWQASFKSAFFDILSLLQLIYSGCIPREQVLYYTFWWLFCFWMPGWQVSNLWLIYDVRLVKSRLVKVKGMLFENLENIGNTLELYYIPTKSISGTQFANKWQNAQLLQQVLSLLWRQSRKISNWLWTVSVQLKIVSTS